MVKDISLAELNVLISTQNLQANQSLDELVRTRGIPRGITIFPIQDNYTYKLLLSGTLYSANERNKIPFYWVLDPKSIIPAYLKATGEIGESVTITGKLEKPNSLTDQHQVPYVIKLTSFDYNNH